MKQQQLCSAFLLLLCISLLITYSVDAAPVKCKPNGKVKGKKPPPNICNRAYSYCCKEGKFYDTYNCSPPVTKRTKATLTINSYEAEKDGGVPSECDKKYYNDDELVVSLSTGWYNKRSRCLKYINIHGNGRTVKAKVVDECDSTMGCDKDHDYQPPCEEDVVDASEGVWKALGVSSSRESFDIYWSDA